MPIKPENKKLYPKNWKQISEYIRFERAKNKCEVCGVENYAMGYRVKGKFHTVKECEESMDNYGEDLLEDIPMEQMPIKIILTVAHLDHNPENNDLKNLKAMCQKCHNNYDIGHRKETRKKSRNKGQLSFEL